MSNEEVLVIEDNHLNMKLVKSLLDLGGYQVVGLTTAEEGIEYLQTRRPHLILMDIQLPGMDGLEATRKIKEDMGIKDIPIIVISSYAMHGDEDKALGMGCDGYLTKPIDTQSFLKTIGSYINRDKTQSD